VRKYKQWAKGEEVVRSLLDFPGVAEFSFSVADSAVFLLDLLAVLEPLIIASPTSWSFNSSGFFGSALC
jgi:hypothetical protein